MKFDAHYINLARAEDRRKTVEGNLADCAFSPDLRFKRFDAVDAVSERVSRTPSSMNPGRTACFLSHLDCLDLSCDNDEHVVIAEDDVLFSPRTEEHLKHVIETFPHQWDIIFADVMIFKPNMAPFLFLKQSLMLKNQFELIDLTKTKIGFAGTTCYVVNKASKKKVHEVLSRHSPMTLPVDVVLREAIRGERLQAYCIFPFITSVTSHARESQVLPDDPVPYVNRLLWVFFRSRVWIGAESDDLSFPNLLTFWHAATN
jgi:GR25 family glycosyltransferase involved in LPS biosynthesis